MKKRILVLLSVVALMVVMLATSVAPAFAAKWNPATGCRGFDLLVSENATPKGPSIDGKRSDDGRICQHDSPTPHHSITTTAP